jgi:adenylyltransferase/sulfurtransferase
MLNIIRQMEFFNPIDINDTIHVIGVGAVGSHTANNLARLNIQELHIWDYDTVESHNIPNQLFTDNDIGKTKTTALANYLQSINPEIHIIVHEKYTNELLRGHVFVCVDSIDVRNQIYKANEFNMYLLSVYDTRIGLEDGQVYSADWHKAQDLKDLLNASNFKKEEVETPKSICGSKLTILPTVQMAATIATSNFINFIKTKTLKRTILFNSFNLYIKAY